MPEFLELLPQEASRLVHGGEAVLIDVREPEEYAIARIDGARLIPMQSVLAEIEKLRTLADESMLVIVCHHGVRSLQVASWLRGKGVENCCSMAGGIDRWSQEIDPTVPRY
jgi:rhodanese-related sulfurtransferase